MSIAVGAVDSRFHLWLRFLFQLRDRFVFAGVGVPPGDFLAVALHFSSALALRSFSALALCFFSFWALNLSVLWFRTLNALWNCSSPFSSLLSLSLAANSSFSVYSGFFVALAGMMVASGLVLL